MKVVLITRIKCINTQKDVNDFFNWLKAFQNHKKILKIYIISDQLSISNLHSIVDGKTEFIPCDNPTGPTSPNLVIDKLSKKEVDAFFITSREAQINTSNIDKLISEIEDNDDLLVVGYKFKLEDERLNNELQDYYANDDLIAFQIPWNTCAIWNYSLFKDFVKEFDDITKNQSGRKLSVCIDNVCHSTEHRGMEDGLAIAKATNKNSEIKFKLLKTKLIWEISINYDKILNHRLKLARKEIVMRNFMKDKGYSVEALLKGAS